MGCSLVTILDYTHCQSDKSGHCPGPPVLCEMHGLYFFLIALPCVLSDQPIERRQIVDKFNVQRNATNSVTPLQVGNGNFAFGADITGLQTFSPFAIMSTWGWHNFSLPTTPNQTSIDGTLSPLLSASRSMLTTP